MEFSSHLDNFNSNLWGYHIPIPMDVAEPFIRENKRRIICKLQNEIEIHCALMPDGKGGWFININKKVRESLGLVRGDKVDVRIEVDESEFGMPMCEEFAEMLRQDPEGEIHFRNLTPGKQRNLIYISANVKSSHIRIRRSLVIVNHLKSQKGKIDFKQLNEEFKQANREGF